MQIAQTFKIETIQIVQTVELMPLSIEMNVIPDRGDVCSSNATESRQIKWIIFAWFFLTHKTVALRM